MRIIEIQEEPLFAIPAVNVARQGIVEEIEIPVHEGFVEALPAGLEAVLVTADLQSHDRMAGGSAGPQLMGTMVARECARRGETGELPPAPATGVILAGDFYTDPLQQRRGGTGDVEAVWHEFARHYRWVAGVAGNHDLFEGEAFFPLSLQGMDHVFPLNGARTEIDGLRVGGVSGIVGKACKPWRHTLDHFSRKLRAASGMDGKPSDVVILHEAPWMPGCRGNENLADAIRRLPPARMLVICGHCHWQKPLAKYPDSEIQVLNVDSRVVILRVRNHAEITRCSPGDPTTKS